MKTAALLRDALENARARQLDTVRVAVKEAIAQLERQMEAMLAIPDNYSKDPVLGDRMPTGASYKGSYKDFIELLTKEIGPLGYTVTESVDSSGRYATYVVKFNEQKPITMGMIGR